MKKIILLLILFMMLTIGATLDPILGLTKLQQSTLLLLFFAMILWTTKIIPSGITSLGIIGLQLLLGISSDFEDAVQGFLFTPIYFILAVSLLNKVLIKIELDKKISHLFLYNTKGNIKRIAGRFFFATLILPIIIPSGNARLQMFIPFMEEINRKHHLPGNSSFVRFTTWTLGGINQLATLIVFTGGGLAVLSFQLLTDLGFELTWISWFLLMAPPIWLTCTLLGTVMFTFYFKKENRQKSPLQITNSISENSPPKIKQQKRFIFVCIIFVLLILLWIVGPWIHLSTITPILLALIAFALPGIRLLDNNDLRNYDWENFLLLGTALSLAVSIEQNGTAKWMSNFIFSIFGQGNSDLNNLVIVMSVILIIRSLFVSPTGALTVTYPLVMTFASTLELNNLYLFLITVILSGSFMIFPMSSPIMIIAHGTGYIKWKEHFLLSVCALVIIFIVTIICYFLYWPLIL